MGKCGTCVYWMTTGQKSGDGVCRCSISNRFSDVIESTGSCERHKPLREESGNGRDVV